MLCMGEPSHRLQESHCAGSSPMSYLPVTSRRLCIQLKFYCRGHWMRARQTAHGFQYRRRENTAFESNVRVNVLGQDRHRVSRRMYDLSMSIIPMCIYLKHLQARTSPALPSISHPDDLSNSSSEHRSDSRRFQAPRVRFPCTKHSCIRAMYHGKIHLLL
jgi:hypothetical protein